MIGPTTNISFCGIGRLADANSCPADVYEADITSPPGASPGARLLCQLLIDALDDAVVDLLEILSRPGKQGEFG